MQYKVTRVFRATDTVTVEAESKAEALELSALEAVDTSKLKLHLNFIEFTARSMADVAADAARVELSKFIDTNDLAGIQKMVDAAKTG